MGTTPIAEPASRPVASPPSETEPLVSVVVVNYNGAEEIEGCLTALAADAAAPPIEILVVDNASTDGSAAIADRLAVEDARITVLRSPINRGYAGGVNVALEHARGSLVAVLNIDVAVGPGWLEPLVALLEARPEAGAVCPLIVLQADPETINAAGQDLNVTGLGFNRWLGRPRSRAGTEPILVSGLHGGAFVIRKQIFDRLGGWDESGFLYAEDVQLSWMLQLLGADVYCEPSSVVVHDYHLTMQPRKLFMLERNRAAMVLANLRTGTLVALSPLFALTELMMWGYCLLRGPRFLKAKLDSYRWLVSQRGQIGTRRKLAGSLRRRSDRQILRRLRWGYAWDQFVTLGRERGRSERREIPAESGGPGSTPPTASG